MCLRCQRLSYGSQNSVISPGVPTRRYIASARCFGAHFAGVDRVLVLFRREMQMGMGLKRPLVAAVIAPLAEGVSCAEANLFEWQLAHVSGPAKSFRDAAGCVGQNPRSAK